MKVLIIGGTGKTGRHLISQGLNKGFVITAMVRNPTKLSYNHPNLIVLKGDVLDKENLEQAVKGQDAVISSLGHKRFFIPTKILSKGTENIIDAMKDHQVKRFICITSLGINDSKFKLGLYYTLFVIPFILLFYFKDKSRQEKLIVNSELDYTIVRPGQLTNGKLRTKIKAGTNIGSYIFTKMISRASVAYFILSMIQNKNYIRKTVGIIN